MTIRVRQNAPQTLQFTATAEGHELPLAMPQPQGGAPTRTIISIPRWAAARR